MHSHWDGGKFNPKGVSRRGVRWPPAYEYWGSGGGAPGAWQKHQEYGIKSNIKRGQRHAINWGSNEGFAGRQHTNIGGPGACPRRVAALHQEYGIKLH